MGMSTSVIPNKIDSTSVDNDYIGVNSSSKITAGDRLVTELGESEIEIIELQANASVTPLTHDSIVSETFSDSTGYNNYVNTGNTTANFNTNKFERDNITAATQVINDNGTVTGLTVGAVTGTIWRIGQSFQTAGTWNEVEVYINATTGTPSGLKCVIYGDNGSNAPDTGTIITSGTLTHASISTGALNKVTLASSFDGSTKYWIVWQTIDENETGNTYYNLSYTNSSTYANGSMSTWNGSIWTNYASADVRSQVSVTASTPDRLVELDLPTISGTVTDTQLIINDVDRETGDEITYELEDASANTDTALAVDTKNTITNLVSVPTKLRVNLNGKATSPTDGYPSVKSVCLKIWKA